MDVDLTSFNARRAIRLTQEGRYGDAMRAVVANGSASPDNVEAWNDIITCLPFHSLPTLPDNHTFSPPNTVDSLGVTSGFKRFPRGSSPGGSKLRAQHLMDITTFTTYTLY